MWENNKSLYFKCTVAEKNAYLFINKPIQIINYYMNPENGFCYFEIKERYVDSWKKEQINNKQARK